MCHEWNYCRNLRHGESTKAENQEEMCGTRKPLRSMDMDVLFGKDYCQDWKNAQKCWEMSIERCDSSKFQFDVILKPPDRLWHVIGHYLDYVIKVGQSSHCGCHHSLSLGPRLYRIGEGGLNMHSFFFVCSWLWVWLAVSGSCSFRFPHPHNDKWYLELSARMSPFSTKLFLVRVFSLIDRSEIKISGYCLLYRKFRFVS